jgi:glycosyltransferase involved in cell wall biosynthesis
MVAALSIERTVEFLGQSDDVNAVLRLADVFALTSKAEGMSNAVLEAMAAGLPCVLTDVGANATCVGEAGSDFVVSPGDVDETVRALTSLLEDANLRASVGSAMLERVRSYYSIESVCDRYEELYARLADEREVGRS